MRPPTMFQSHRAALGPVAQVPRHVTEDACELERARASRRGYFENVVALGRVERAEFISHDDLVVRHDRHAAETIIDNVDINTDVPIPHEALFVVTGETLDTDVRVEPGQKLQTGRLSVGLGWWGRLRVDACGARHERQHKENAARH